jgi:quinol-cytochrome oxidoreductase complex cytochrome b subunit
MKRTNLLGLGAGDKKRKMSSFDQADTPQKSIDMAETASSEFVLYVIAFLGTFQDFFYVEPKTALVCGTLKTMI